MEKSQKKNPPQISQDKLSIEYDKDDFFENLPNLAKELLNPYSNSKLQIQGISNQIEGTEETNSIDDMEEVEDIPELCDEIPKDPNVIEFLRRCSKPQDALEIISYLRNNNEITEEEAQTYRDKLEKEGLQSFGEYKSPGYYERKFRRNFKQHSWE